MIVSHERDGRWRRYMAVHRGEDMIEIVLGGQIARARHTGDLLGVNSALCRNRTGTTDMIVRLRSSHPWRRTSGLGSHCGRNWLWSLIQARVEELRRRLHAPLRHPALKSLRRRRRSSADIMVGMAVLLPVCPCPRVRRYPQTTHLRCQASHAWLTRRAHRCLRCCVVCGIGTRSHILLR